MKYQKQTIGAILQIHINDEYYVYAQILSHGSQVFFDYRTKEPLTSFEVLEQAPILFISCVYSYVITKCYWLKVGKMPVRDEF